MLYRGKRGVEGSVPIFRISVTHTSRPEKTELLDEWDKLDDPVEVESK